MISKKRTIRPVSLRRVVEICNLLLKNAALDVETVSLNLSTTATHAKEILLEVEKMHLMDYKDGFWRANGNTREFLNYFEKEDWEKINQYFFENYQFYKEFIVILQAHIKDEKGLTIEEINKESLERSLHLNKTAIEILADWCERLGIAQRHLFTSRIYLLEKNTRIFENFLFVLISVYHELSFLQGRKAIFVEIPLIRENVCEILKISRITFNSLLKDLYSKNIGKIELSGAPITTLAKKSPLGEKKMFSVDKNVSVKSGLKREREGLTINQKAYYYLALHETHSLKV